MTDLLTSPIGLLIGAGIALLAWNAIKGGQVKLNGTDSQVKAYKLLAKHHGEEFNGPDIKAYLADEILKVNGNGKSS